MRLCVVLCRSSRLRPNFAFGQLAEVELADGRSRVSSRRVGGRRGGEGWGPRRVPAGGVWRRSGGAGVRGEEESGGVKNTGADQARVGQTRPKKTPGQKETWPKWNWPKWCWPKKKLAKEDLAKVGHSRSPGLRRVGAPDGWEPRRVGPKISRFFFPSPATILSFFPLLGVFSVEFWWCLKR